MVFGRGSTVGGDGLTNEQRYAKRMAERKAKEAAARAKREAAAKPKAPAFGKSQDKTSAAYKKILADRAATKAAADKKAVQMAAARKAASDKKAADIKRQQDQAKRLAAKKAADAAAKKAADAAAKAAAKPVAKPAAIGKNSLVGGDGLTNAERYAKRRAEAEAKAAAAAVRKATDSRGNANAFGTEWDVNSNRDNPYGVTSIKDSSGLGFSGNPEHFITSGNPADMQGIEVGYITDKEQAPKPPMPPAEPTKGQPPVNTGGGMGGMGAFFNSIRNGTATNIKGNPQVGGTDASVTVDQSAGNPQGMFNSLAGVVNNIRNPNTPEPVKFTQEEIDAELKARAEAAAAEEAAAQLAAANEAAQNQAALFNPTQEAGPDRNRNFQTVNYGTQGGTTPSVNTGIGVASQSQATPWADAYMRAQQSSARQGPISGLFSKEMENS